MSALREITNQTAERKADLKSQWKGKRTVFDEEGIAHEVIREEATEERAEISLDQISLNSSLEVETSTVQEEDLEEIEVVDEEEANKENKEQLYREPRKPNFKFEGKHKVFVDEEELTMDQEEVTPTQEVEKVTEGLQRLTTTGNEQ